MLREHSVSGTVSGQNLKYNLSQILRSSHGLQKLFSVGLLISLILPGVLMGQSARGQNSRSTSLAGYRSEIPPGEKPAPTNEKTHSSIPGDQLGGAGCGWSTSVLAPEPVLDQAVTEHNGSLYMFAGVGGGALLSSARKFDGSTWTTLASMPVGREYPSAVSDGTFIYIMAGADDLGASTNTLYKYDPTGDSYTPLASSSQITWNQGAAYLNGKIYKLGGSTAAGVYTNALEIYDIAGNAWTAGAPYPLQIGYPNVWSDGTYIYAAGGVGPSSASSLKTYRYDPVANTWDDASIADLPAERWGAAGSLYNGKFVMAGGYVGPAGGTLSATSLIYNPTANTWSPLPDLTSAQARFGGGVTNGSFFAVGGRDAAGGFNGTDINHKLFCPPLNAPFFTGDVSYVSDNGTPANGVPDPGETATVSLEVNNVGGAASGSTTVTLESSGGITNPSGPVNYGVIAANGSATNNFTFTVPPSANCGDEVTLTFNITDGAVSATVTQTYSLGVRAVSVSENFDGVTAPALSVGLDFDTNWLWNGLRDNNRTSKFRA